MELMQLFSARRIIPELLFIMVITLGCRNTADQSIDSLSKILENGRILLPSDSTDQIYDKLKRERSVIRFYTLRNNSPAWSDTKKLSILGDSMILFIKNIRYYGLLPRNYHLNEIEAKKQSVDQSGLLRIDVLLTDAFISIARDLKYGRLNDLKAIDDSLQISLLEQILNGGDLKRNLSLQEPRYLGYIALKEALKLSLDTLEDEDQIGYMGGMAKDTDPLERKLRLIEINLERWRSENLILGDHYIFINIPSFWLEVVSRDSAVLESKVIVGTPTKPTPILSSLLECFVIYPYWHVPRKIAVDEYLPIIEKSTSFLKRNNFDVLDRNGNILNPDVVEWKKFSKKYFPVLLRQREGPESALGVLKFVFDNPYTVFLHDTNSKQLFRSDARAFSHGCIRMEKAVELAHYLVTEEINKKSKTIQLYLKQRRRHTIDLPNPIPIHVRYFTCEFKESVFREYKDLYKKDQKLIDFLYQ